MRYATKEFKEWLEKRDTLISKRSLEVLDKDIFIIINYRNTYYLEPTTSFVRIPNYVYSQFQLFKREQTKKEG